VVPTWVRTYDSRGNLTNDGVNTNTWDRANRLLSSAGVTTTYDGLGNRVTRTAGGTTTRTLLDLQPSSAQSLASTTGSNVTRHIHAAGDLLAHKDSAGNWEWFLPDGLGSVRGVVSNSASVLEHRHFDPFGNLYAGTMAQTDYGFTGEPFDATSGLVYLRSRHYRPANGTFTSRDPFEGTMSRPMSRNGYSWVEGRVADGRDPSGMIYEALNLPQERICALLLRYSSIVKQGVFRCAIIDRATMPLFESPRNVNSPYKLPILAIIRSVSLNCHIFISQ